jgi:hypothetical protein
MMGTPKSRDILGGFSIMWLNTSYQHPDDLPPDRWDTLMMTRPEYEAMVKDRSERDKRAPKVGDSAPDFEIERLSSNGRRTGEMFRLSQALGRPMGLVFGSYT